MYTLNLLHLVPDNSSYVRPEVEKVSAGWYKTIFHSVNLKQVFDEEGNISLYSYRPSWRKS
jgi:hypothetical protein